MSSSKTVILLATYNGETYLKEQIDSLLNQTVDATIIARDDGSSDSSLEILRSYQEIIVVNDLDFDYQSPDKNSYFAPYIRNFSILCEFALTIENAEYFYFCDQDDVWLPNKVERLNSEIDNLSKNGKIPVLVHSDLKVVNEKLDVFSSSFVKMECLPEPNQHKFPMALHQNVATGCASAFNRSLLSYMTPIDPRAAVHDFWLYVGAKTLGVSKFVAEPLVLYRQHGKNSIGSTAKEREKGLLSLYFYKNLLAFPKNFAQTIKQAQAVVDVCEKKTEYTNSQYSMLVDFAELTKQNFTKRSVNKVFPRKLAFLEKVYLKIVLLIIPRFEKK